MASSSSRSRAAVVGAGPVGCLAALSLANRGFDVDVYERRSDPRPPPQAHASSSSSSNNDTQLAEKSAPTKPIDRSINLAISARGLKALSAVQHSDSQGENLAEVLLRHAVPMRARMIHTKGDGKAGGAGPSSNSQAYSTAGEHINSVSRSLLNTLLVEAAAAHPKVSLHFDCKLRAIDLEAKEHVGEKEAQGQCSLSFDSFEGKEEKSTRWADLVVGCDGINSIVRNTLARLVPLNFHQEYIDSEYIELRIPPAQAPTQDPSSSASSSSSSSRTDIEYALDPHHLHIWPRQTFMLIALANLDHSFTSTLFAPNSILSTLTTREAVLRFFRQEFPDALPLFGEEELVEMVLRRGGKGARLSSIKCDPYHYGGRAVILGDAAHAMLPFYGQGLNCGFEDVGVFAELLDQHGVRGDHPSSSVGLASALSQYTRDRHADLVAIVDLAADNYRVMSSSVVDPLYLLRKQLDSLLMTWLPKGWWSSLYSMVTFSPDVGYARAMQREEWQQRLLQRVIVGGGAAVVGATVGLGWVWRRGGLERFTTPFVRRGSAL
ncbi:FAD/NAD(P)-binding domain-containing protein [Jaminaea rosea]|uniref:Kynurenine 3-monooxygenase n=1 Tax=Jaminaea rosea TaxID=1569628 RepID=A0A316UZE6_9BASI|nr:FAD/NAD(P)-binding domain-containing protein [Jaminaea rosea]PWN30669.1 FAD/NAD(P)-binding domain-containing protein [Jaminaea rosea]